MFVSRVQSVQEEKKKKRYERFFEALARHELVNFWIALPLLAILENNKYVDELLEYSYFLHHGLNKYRGRP